MCSVEAKGCYSFTGKDAKLFEKYFPDVIGMVCVERSGVQCVHTNVAYTTCKAASGKLHVYQ